MRNSRAERGRLRISLTNKKAASRLLLCLSYYNEGGDSKLKFTVVNIRNNYVPNVYDNERKNKNY